MFRMMLLLNSSSNCIFLTFSKTVVRFIHNGGFLVICRILIQLYGLGIHNICIPKLYELLLKMGVIKFIISFGLCIKFLKTLRHCTGKCQTSSGGG